MGASALCPNNFEVPSGAMALGVPAKLKLDAVDSETMIDSGAALYAWNGERYLKELRRLD